MVQFVDVDGYPFRFEYEESGKTIIHRIDEKNQKLVYLTTAENVYDAVDYIKEWVNEADSRKMESVSSS